MKFDGMTKGVVNLDERHQLLQMWCMPKQKKGRNSIMPKALQPLHMKIVYEWNMLNNDKIILPLLCKDNHMQETKHKNAKVKAHCG